MAAPNIVNVSTIIGKTVYASLSSTSATTVVSNSASSNKVFKINSLIVSNVDGVNAADITVNLYAQAALAGTAYAIAKTISVPADSTLIIIDKNTSVYLEEDKSIGAIAGTANDLEVICSYEEISST